VKIHLLRDRATPEQVAEMLEELKTLIKLAVDIKRGIIAGGGEWHADCEKILLEDGSQQEDIWGADWLPMENAVRFEAMINIRPRQNNRTMTIQDPDLRARIEKIVRSFFE
jgi:Protein of unknown function (DUF5674)